MKRDKPAPQPQALPQRPGKSQWLLVFFALVFATFAILGFTIAVPFFTVDDSDVLLKCENILQKWKSGDLLFLFEPNSHAHRRYYPGYAAYATLRLAVLGKTAPLWHVWHLLLFSAIGMAMAAAGRMLAGSWAAGCVAYLVLISTGTVSYQSNWFNFVFLNTFEPWLLALWVAGAALFSAGRTWALAAGTFCFLWAMVSKENAIIAMFPAFTISGFLFLRKPEWFGERERVYRLAVPCLAIAACCVIYAVVLYLVLPRDAGYAGTQTLLKKPSQWWDNFQAQRRNWIEASWYLVPIGMLHFGVRLAATWRKWESRDAWMLILLGALLAQIGSLLLWPSTAMRLSQPAYAAALLFACVELEIFLRQSIRMRSQSWTRHDLIAVGLLAASLLLLLLLRANWGYVAFARGTKLVAVLWTFAILGMLLFSYLRARSFPHWASGGMKAVLALCTIFVILLIAINTSSYPTLARTTEGSRQRVAELISSTAVRGARVAWVLPKDQEMIAWSSGLNTKAVYQREDIVQGPARQILSLGPLRKGDYLVTYGSAAKQNPRGEGRLSRKTVHIGGWVSPVLSLPELYNVLLSNPAHKKPLKPAFSETEIPIYQVQSETFIPQKEYLAQFAQ